MLLKNTGTVWIISRKCHIFLTVSKFKYFMVTTAVVFHLNFLSYVPYQVKLKVQKLFSCHSKRKLSFPIKSPHRIYTVKVDSLCTTHMFVSNKNLESKGFTDFTKTVLRLPNIKGVHPTIIHTHSWELLLRGMWPMSLDSHFPAFWDNMVRSQNVQVEFFLDMSTLGPTLLWKCRRPWILSLMWP